MSTVNQQLFARLPEDQQTALLARNAQHGNGVYRPTGVTPEEQSSLVPALPDSAWLDPALGRDACRWLDNYAGFSRIVSPRAYDPFHEAAGIWLLSTVAAGRLELQLGQKLFVPTLYIAFVAHTTLHAKTTTARVAQEVLRVAGLDHLLLPNDTTPQAMVSRMTVRVDLAYGEMTQEEQEAERQRLVFPAQRGWFYDEFGAKVQAMMRENGPMADFRGHLRVFDDHPATYRYETLSRRDAVQRPCLSLLASMTPADIRRFAGRDAALWGDGFWPRFAFITPPLHEAVGTGRFPNQAVAIPEELVRPLQLMYRRLGVPRVDIYQDTDDEGEPVGPYRVDRDDLLPVSLADGDGLLDAFYAYHDGLVRLAREMADAGNSDLIGNYGRFAEKAMRIAMLLAGVNGQDTITLGHWTRAQSITERWRECLHHMAEQVAIPTASKESRQHEQIESVLQRHGPQTPNEIAKNIRGLDAPEAQRLCEQLTKAGTLVVAGETRKHTKRYGLAEETAS